MFEENEITRGLIGKYVDTYAFVDGPFEVRSKGRSLPYKIFGMDLRVTHAAITDTKRLNEHLGRYENVTGPNHKFGRLSEVDVKNSFSAVLLGWLDTASYKILAAVRGFFSP